MARPFMTSELAIVREHFPLGGAKECVPRLTGRTELSVRLMAWRNGIKRDAGALRAIRMRNMRNAAADDGAGEGRSKVE